MIMEIALVLEKWPDDSPVSHNSTKIYIKDNTKTIVSEEVIDTLVYVRELNVPIGEKYYAIAERQFTLKDSTYDISNINYESEEFEIYNNDIEISNMLLEKEVVIDKPVIYFNKSDIDLSDGLVTIKSSSYRGVGDGHTHTHWVIYGNGKVIFTSLTDNVNKTSINVEKSLFYNQAQIKVVCIHCSNNIESEVSILDVRINKFNFQLVSDLENQPLQEYTIKIEKVLNSDDMRLIKVNVLHEEVLLKKYDINNNLESFELRLGARFMEPGRYLTIDLYGYDNEALLGKKTYVLKPITVNYEDNINKRYTYDKKITSINQIIDIPNGLVSDNVGNIIFVPNATTIDRYTVATNGTLTFLDNTGMTHGGTKEGMYINYNNDNTIFIDCYNSLGKPTFMIYEFHKQLNQYILKKSLIREDEQFTVTKCNAIEQINNDEFIYSVYGTNKLRKYNRKTNMIYDLSDIPMAITEGTLIIKLNDNNLLVMPNKTFKTFIYKTDENSYLASTIISEQDLIGVDTKKADLINGDKLIFSTSLKNGANVYYFNSSSYKLTLLPDKIDSNGNFIIYKSNNDVFINNFVLKDHVVSNDDSMDINRFE